MIVVTLVRRSIEGVDDPQLKQAIMKDADFLDYPEHVIEEIQGANGCIW